MNVLKRKYVLAVNFVERALSVVRYGVFILINGINKDKLNSPVSHVVGLVKSKLNSRSWES